MTSDDQAQKPDVTNAPPKDNKPKEDVMPDASPMEWLWIGVLDGLDLGECKTRLIEKSAYDAIAKELELCKCVHGIPTYAFCQECDDAALPIYRERDALAKELAAAQAENIGNLQLIGGMDARIKELEDEVEALKGTYDDVKIKYVRTEEREQKLVAALESSNKTILHLMEEYARGNGLDVGRLTIDFNNGLIKAHNGGA